jgi:HTH-type transcriptional regulator/antitoxin HigA
MMNQTWKILKTGDDYNAALARLDAIVDAALGSPDGDELELLVLLISNYEERHFPVKLPEPLEMIKLRMEELGLKNKDMVDIIGAESHVSSVLSGKRQITLEMARRLSKKLNIRASIFINDERSFEEYENEGSPLVNATRSTRKLVRGLTLSTQTNDLSKYSGLADLLGSLDGDKESHSRDKSPLIISYAHRANNEHIYIRADAVLPGMKYNHVHAEQLSDFVVRLDNEKQI